MANSPSILDSPLVSEMCFFPRRQDPPDCLWVPVDGARLACHLVRVDPELPTLVYFHGNGEVVADYLPDMANLLAGLGANVLFAEYRGYGGSSGQPALVRMLDDVGPLLEAAGAPPNKLVVFGRSIGSLYAVEAVRLEQEVGALVLESGIADALQLFGQYAPLDALGPMRAILEREVHSHFDQRSKLASYPGRVLVLHSRDDEIIPLEHGERLYQWAAPPSRRRRFFESGGHNGIFVHNRQAYLDALAEVIRDVDRQGRDES